MAEYVCRGCGELIAIKSRRPSKMCRRCNAMKNIGSGKMGKKPTHGGYGTRLYRIWAGMKQRCSNPKRGNYVYYGGRGISVCDEWVEFAAFAEWADRAGYADGLTLERQDNGGDYEPDNCCWVTHRRQCENRSNARRVMLNGQEVSFQEAGASLGIPWRTLYKRIYVSGWDADRALSTPVTRVGNAAD